MSLKRILAVDPGGMSGLACRAPDSTGRVLTWTTSTPEELWKDVTARQWDVVVCERFAASLISKWGLYTVKLVGGIAALCMDRNIEFVLRTPQQRYAYQEEAGRLLKGTKHVIHETEALAHLLAYEAFLERQETDATTPVATPRTGTETS